MLKENVITYRNKKDFLTSDNFIIDEGSLWNFSNGKLILLDDDNFVETDLDLNLFQKSE